MKSEFAEHVDSAANIKTSGRWAAMNAKIKRLAVNPGVGNEWYIQLFGALCFQVFSEYSQLENAYDENRERDVSLLAWRARNLVELFVWSRYSAQSQENARRLYEDAGRDTHEIYRAFEKWGQTRAQSADWLKPITSATQDLSQRAAAEGIETLERTYKHVTEAANDCGIKDHYTLIYKFLSKFSHPTAMQILGASNDAEHALQRDCFFSQGCLYFTGAFVALENVPS